MRRQEARRLDNCGVHRPIVQNLCAVDGKLVCVAAEVRNDSAVDRRADKPDKVVVAVTAAKSDWANGVPINDLGVEGTKHKMCLKAKL